MKTHKELNKRGTDYLCGYTDALTDLAIEVGLNNPDLHDCTRLKLLAFLNDYMGDLLKEGEVFKNAAK